MYTHLRPLERVLRVIECVLVRRDVSLEIRVHGKRVASGCCVASRRRFGAVCLCLCRLLFVNALAS